MIIFPLAPTFPARDVCDQDEEGIILAASVSRLSPVCCVATDFFFSQLRNILSKERAKRVFQTGLFLLKGWKGAWEGPVAGQGARGTQPWLWELRASLSSLFGGTGDWPCPGDLRNSGPGPGPQGVPRSLKCREHFCVVSLCKEEKENEKMLSCPHPRLPPPRELQSNYFYVVSFYPCGFCK